MYVLHLVSLMLWFRGFSHVCLLKKSVFGELEKAESIPTNHTSAIENK